jgi:hypothetical protein
LLCWGSLPAIWVPGTGGAITGFADLYQDEVGFREFLLHVHNEFCRCARGSVPRPALSPECRYEIFADYAFHRWEVADCQGAFAALPYKQLSHFSLPDSILKRYQI